MMDMERYYHFAGVDLAISIPESRMFAQEGHLAPFRVEKVENPYRFRLECRDVLAAPEGIRVAVEPAFCVYRAKQREIRYIGARDGAWETAYMRVEQREREWDVQLLTASFPGVIGVTTVLTALCAEHLVVPHGGVVFHSACIEYQGRAIVFTAPSGTGKSTQAELWRKLRNAEIVNGDRAVLRWEADGAYACGIPFAGSSRYCENKTLPLEAIVYLGQAPKTTIQRLRGTAAFARIWEGCSVNTWSAEDMARASDTVMRIAQSVPVFYLPCTPDETAVIALENALKEMELR